MEGRVRRHDPAINQKKRTGGVFEIKSAIAVWEREEHEGSRHYGGGRSKRRN